jgi:hypothetical protein
MVQRDFENESTQTVPDVRNNGVQKGRKEICLAGPFIPVDVIFM